MTLCASVPPASPPPPPVSAAKGQPQAENQQPPLSKRSRLESPLRPHKPVAAVSQEQLQQELASSLKRRRSDQLERGDDSMTDVMAPMAPQPQASAPITTADSSSTATVEELAAIHRQTLRQEEKQMDGAPEGELFVVTVLTRDELQPSANVETEMDTLQQLLARKQAPQQTAEGDADAPTAVEISWASEYYAVESVRRLAVHHPELVKTHLSDALAVLICPAVSNLRSAVARNALLCIQDLIECTPTAVLPHFDSVIPLLLHRAANEKQFIRDLARTALDSALETKEYEAFAGVLLTHSSTEKNPQAVSVAGIYTQRCLLQMDDARVRVFVDHQHPAFLQEMTSFLNCRIVECKAAARKTLQRTRKALGDSEFTKLVQSNLTGIVRLDVLKASEQKKTVARPAAKMSIRDRMALMRKQQSAKPAPVEVDVIVPKATIVPSASSPCIQ